MSKKTQKPSETYTKLNPVEHVLLRPGMYLGSTTPSTELQWIYSEETQRMKMESLTFTSGFHKIIDEVITNCTDHKSRYPKDTTYIKVNSAEGSNTISVENNGPGIPVELHEKEQVYIPEMIFGHLLTSSNYDETKMRTGAGLNGVGVKICNIFSKKFMVETVCNGKKFSMEWENNMGNHSKPKLKESVKSKDYTFVEFTPDLQRFGMTEITKDDRSLILKKLYDIAGTMTDIKIFWNGKQLPVKNFTGYCELYTEDVYSLNTTGWEVCVKVHTDKQFKQTCFVNSLLTPLGGTHVTYVVDQIVNEVLEIVKKKKLEVKPIQIKNSLWIFINAKINNPTFDSQTKNALITKSSQFNVQWAPTPAFIKKIVASGILDSLEEISKAKEAKDMAKMDGKKTTRIIGVEKLDDANKAGTRESGKCSLILTEGDSARAFAIAGLSVVGRDYYGVFPLRGKLLNVKDASTKQLTGNKEIQNLIKILGLQFGKTYDNADTIRYGSIIIATDMDSDAHHIAGLILNLFEVYWPSLLRIPKFMKRLYTPLITASTKNKKMAEVQEFFTKHDFEQWMETKSVSTYTIKYRKGLGTNTSEDAKRIFANLHRYLKAYDILTEEGSEKLDRSFSKKRAQDRKEWLQSVSVNDTSESNLASLINTKNAIAITDFVDKELVNFSHADNIRSIPSVVDGLKPSQRKVLFTCFKRNIKNPIKVAQLAASVAEMTEYEHGEQSLCSTIVNLAQDYVGSNNLNVLVPDGQFGTRLMGGKDQAAPRYIYTYLSEYSRDIFSKQDDAVLIMMESEGKTIEPQYYIPSFPMILVNGSKGIGTGFSTSIPSFKPEDIVEVVRAYISGRSDWMNMANRLTPWYKGFKGTIEADTDTSVESEESHRYIVSGMCSKIKNDTYKVFELPIGTWTNDFKEFLETMVTEGKIKDFRDDSTDTTVSFTINVDSSVGAIDPVKFFKLQSTISKSNMVAFDPSGKIKQYTDISMIFEDFFKVKDVFLLRRKNHVLQDIQQRLKHDKNKYRFIKLVVDDELIINKRSKTEIGKEMMDIHSFKQEDISELLNLSISNLTMESLKTLETSIQQMVEETRILEEKNIHDIWRDDLEKIKI